MRVTDLKGDTLHLRKNVHLFNVSINRNVLERIKVKSGSFQFNFSRDIKIKELMFLIK